MQAVVAVNPADYFLPHVPDCPNCGLKTVQRLAGNRCLNGCVEIATLKEKDGRPEAVLVGDRYFSEDPESFFL